MKEIYNDPLLIHIYKKQQEIFHAIAGEIKQIQMDLDVCFFFLFSSASHLNLLGNNSMRRSYTHILHRQRCHIDTLCLYSRQHD